MSQVAYLNNSSCPTCRGDSSSSDPVPLWISIVVVFLLFNLFFVMFFRYSMVKREAEMCMAFRRMETAHLMIDA